MTLVAVGCSKPKSEQPASDFIVGMHKMRSSDKKNFELFETKQVFQVTGLYFLSRPYRHALIHGRTSVLRHLLACPNFLTESCNTYASANLDL